MISQGFHLIVSSGCPARLSAIVYLEEPDGALLVQMPTHYVDEANVETALLELYRAAKRAAANGGIPEHDAETLHLKPGDLENVVPIRPS